MLIHGYRETTTVVRSEAIKPCSHCGKEQSFSLIINYGYHHIYFVFGMLKFRRYFLVCDVCGTSHKAKCAEVEPTLGGIPVPFMLKYGFLLLPVVVPAFVLGVASIGFFIMTILNQFGWGP